MGGPEWDTLDPAIRPERGLLGIRKALGLFANLQPTILFLADDGGGHGEDAFRPEQKPAESGSCKEIP